jgi:hypothetical protein
VKHFLSQLLFAKIIEIDSGEKMQKFVVLLMLLISALSVSAWDDAGHKISAYIAWQRMSPEVREKAVKILLSAPEDSDLSVFYLQDSRSEATKKRELFMIAATWADIVRDRKFDVRYKTYHKGNWHYSDTFWSNNNGKFELLTGFEEGGMATEKLYEFDKVMRDSTVADADKAIALAWILHLGGDIHQPLHTSARVTDLEPKGDQGGNLFSLTPEGTVREKSENLHWYWDSITGRNIPRKNDACDTDYLLPIADAMMKKYPFAKMQNKLALGNFDEWQKESFAFNQTDVFSADLKRYQMPSEKYKKNALRVAQQQITLAGYRLGEMMNQILGSNSASSNVNANAQVCKIIRRVQYPVTKTRSSDESVKLEIGLLNLCPANPGIVARPMYSTMDKDGKVTVREYDVEKVFKTEQEAREFAANNGITDISFQ